MDVKPHKVELKRTQYIDLSTRLLVVLVLLCIKIEKQNTKDKGLVLIEITFFNEHNALKTHPQHTRYVIGL